MSTTHPASPAPTADATTIRRAAGECLKRVDLSKRLRLLGVRVGHLENRSALESSGMQPGEQGGLDLF